MNRSRTVLGRLLAAVIAVGMNWIASNLGFEYDPEINNLLSDFITLAVYAVSHKVIDSKLNPPDVAKPSLNPESQQ
jgi:hypothetical protein